MKNEISQYAKSHFIRRKDLLEAMENLESQKVDCLSCPGTCCTFVGNSMQVTVLEALDLYLYLQEENLWGAELVQRLKQTVRDFRLDVRPTTGAGQLMRKTYTCPFFGHKNLGCPLPREVKPYGCLGFNPTTVAEESGKSCHSDNALLIKREQSLPNESELSEELQRVLKLAWQKESIPVALLEIHDHYQDLK